MLGNALLLARPPPGLPLPFVFGGSSTEVVSPAESSSAPEAASARSMERVVIRTPFGVPLPRVFEKNRLRQPGNRHAPKPQIAAASKKTKQIASASAVGRGCGR